MCAEKAFIDNIQDEESDSLRRVMFALSKHSPYRLTPEFEALISFSDN